MLKNYLKVAFRNFRKQKLYSLINIFGLAIGIACCILIYLFISDEYSFDRFHENSTNIYRVEEKVYEKIQSEIEPVPFYDTRSPEGSKTLDYLPMPLGPTLKDRFPEIKNYVGVRSSYNQVRRNDISFNENVVFTDPSFFEVFSFPLLKGSPETVLDNINSIVLNEKIANKYFKDSEAIGENLIINIFGEEKIFTVTGVAKEPPKNSSIYFSILIRMEHQPYYEHNRDRWNSYNTPLFVELEPNSDLELVKSKLDELVQEYYGERMVLRREQLGLPEKTLVQELVLSPISSIHLNAAVNIYKVSNPLYSFILGLVAILILAIACINYVTLALAKSSSRTKEIGVRKVSGAKEKQLALQFWGETQLITFFGMFTGVCLAEISLPFFNSLAEKSLSINYLQDGYFFIALIGVTLLTGLLAGTYPALVLAGYEPVKALKGPSTFQFKPRLIKGLLVLQYCFSIFLIISVSIMYKQMNYITSKDLGYNEEQVVFINVQTTWRQGINLMELFRNEALSLPGIQRISGMAPAFTTGTSRYGFDIDGDMKYAYAYYIDHEMVPLLDFEIVAGRSFFSGELDEQQNSIIINESLAADLNLENPIGKIVSWGGQNAEPAIIIGIVRNFHFQSLESDIEPMLFHVDSKIGGIASIAVKVNEGMIAETLPELKKIWLEILPYAPFDYWFLDEAVQRQYKDYKRWLNIIRTSTIIAILIACLGLFGLAGLIAINKTKEIGIRKVLGARLDQIIILLNKDIVILISISLLISAPFSLYIMKQWLSNFSYQIAIGVDIFAISAIIALFISICTVSYHSVKAAFINPVKSLKNE